MNAACYQIFETTKKGKIQDLSLLPPCFHCNCTVSDQIMSLKCDDLALKQKYILQILTRVDGHLMQE